MFRIYILLFIGFSLVLSSCDKEEAGELSLQFEATYGEQALEFITGYPTSSTFNIQFTKSDFFISDLVLVSDNGDEIILSDVEFVDITSAYSGGTPATAKFDYKQIPAGTYTQLKFGFGVSPSQNSKVPADYESTSPLSRTSHYWTAWNSFIFSKLEGRLDTAGNDVFDFGFIYHLGTNDIYKTFVFDVPIKVDGNNTDVKINIDYEKMINPTNGNILPIIESPLNHDPRDLNAFNTIITNFSGAIQLTLD